MGGTTTRYIYSGTKVIAEYVNGAAVGSPTKEYIYSGSQLLATLNGGTPTYHRCDHLSARVNTNSSGTTVGQQGHYPFGESWYATSTTTKWQFTAYERDSESTLDYAIFRYDSSRLGRFMTPDPIAGSIFNPQSLNRYPYTRNDPVNLIDPLGLSEHIPVLRCRINGTWVLGDFCRFFLFASQRNVTLLGAEEDPAKLAGLLERLGNLPTGVPGIGRGGQPPPPLALQGFENCMARATSKFIGGFLTASGYIGLAGLGFAFSAGVVAVSAVPALADPEPLTRAAFTVTAVGGAFFAGLAAREIREQRAEARRTVDQFSKDLANCRKRFP